MKIKSKSILTILPILLFFAMFLPSCDRKGISPKDKECSDTTLTVTAEVVDWTCAAVGVWDGIQFKTQKGEYLQPWELLLKIMPSAIELKAKQQVTVTYSTIKADDRYKDKQVCPTFVALPATTIIRVHSITILKN